MTERLTNTVAVVTGGASGNGRAIALAFARHGARAVVVGDMQVEPREGGQPTQERILTETQTRATFVPCDVTRLADLEAALEAAEAFGGVEVLVNNAGVFREQDLPFGHRGGVSVPDGHHCQRSLFWRAGRRQTDGAKGRGCIINLSSW